MCVRDNNLYSFNLKPEKNPIDLVTSHVMLPSTRMKMKSVFFSLSVSMEKKDKKKSNKQDSTNTILN